MTKIQTEIRRTLGDAYAFVRSQEANKAIQSVTMVQLLREQIDRNGDTERSNASQFNPYSYDPDKIEPATRRPLARANFLSGTDTGNPTKLDRVLAIQNTISDLVAQVKALPLEEVNSAALTDADANKLLTTDPLIIGSDAVAQDLEEE